MQCEARIRNRPVKPRHNDQFLPFNRAATRRTLLIMWLVVLGDFCYFSDEILGIFRDGLQ
jgi:hypothetical protein